MLIVIITSIYINETFSLRLVYFGTYCQNNCKHFIRNAGSGTHLQLSARKILNLVYDPVADNIGVC